MPDPRGYGSDREDLGRFAYNIYCKTCTEAEFEAGASRPISILEVEAKADHILVRGDRYFPVGEDGAAQHASFANSPDTFDRMD
ncbi:MAG: hypothetical protein AAFY42_14435 [Pseudomonadota bacterium]